MKSKSAMLIDVILKIPGKKQVTVISIGEAQTFDIAANGDIGYDKEHALELRRAIGLGISSPVGAIIVRQFIPNSEELVTFPNGKQGMMPRKSIYAIATGNEKFEFLSAEDVELAMTTDSETGERIDPEPYVIYQDIQAFSDVTMN
ncbi:hypothetical protein H8K35_08230 [Undibacterium sp. LX40W]|uniref:Uncharacterized protein n=1 Tax=Undibacterium nitidum TaxID=2762298 RepID=A0A923KTG9_9BURK|nr:MULTISPECIES: hypothetical protein [Undibacterium]MBC3881579.1 hypothetical protein [Undibacterium nitidum]MBC3891639.1 hypothetical protein [Undibacterium sp. LX40W]